MEAHPSLTPPPTTPMKPRHALLLLLSALSLAAATAAEPLVLNLWPATPPGDTATLPPEADLTKDTDKLIAGRRIIKTGNVTTPQLAVYRPAKEKDTGASVIICPGGGFNTTLSGTGILSGRTRHSIGKSCHRCG